jgi:hypothetical protein
MTLCMARSPLKLIGTYLNIGLDAYQLVTKRTPEWRNRMNSSLSNDEIGSMQEIDTASADICYAKQKRRRVTL